MDARIEFIIHQRDLASLVPNWLVHGAENQHFKILAEDIYGDVVEREIFLGLSDGEFVEILSPVEKNTVFLYQPLITLEKLTTVSTWLKGD